MVILGVVTVMDSLLHNIMVVLGVKNCLDIINQSILKLKVAGSCLAEIHFLDSIKLFTNELSTIRPTWK